MNEPAFPIAFVDQSESEFDGQQIVEFGITVLDYFAAHCPSDLINAQNRESAEKFLGIEFPDQASMEQQTAYSMAVEAKARYLYADAMLAERDKRNGESK